MPVQDALVEAALRAHDTLTANMRADAFAEAEKWLHLDLCIAARAFKVVEIADGVTTADPTRTQRFALHPKVDTLRASTSLQRKVFASVEKRFSTSAGGGDNGDDRTVSSLKELLPASTYQAQLQRRVDLVLAAFQDDIKHTLTLFVPTQQRASGTGIAFTDVELARLRTRLQTSGVSSLLLLISLGKGLLSPEYVRLKLALQTVSLYEPTQHYNAARASLLVPTFNEAARFVRRTVGATLHISVSFAEEALGWGIVTSLVQRPDSQATVCVDRSTSSVFLLLRGRPPRDVFVNGMRVRVRLSARPTLLKQLRIKHKPPRQQRLEGKGASDGDDDGDDGGGDDDNGGDTQGVEHNISSSSMLTTAALHAQILRALGTFTSQLKAVATHQHDTVRLGLSFVHSLVKQLQSEPLNMDELTTLAPASRMGVVADRKRFLTHLQQLLNTIQFCCDAALDQTHTPAEIHTWLVKASEMKYGARALKRSNIASISVRDIVTNLHHRTSRVAAITAADTATSASRDVSLHSKLSWLQHLQHMARHAAELSARITPRGRTRHRIPFTTAQLLYVAGVTGALVRVQGSEAANVDPWAIKVMAVSCDFSDSASAMCALDSNVPLHGRRRGATSNQDHDDDDGDDDDGDRNEVFNGVLPLCPPEAASIAHGIVASKLMRAYHAVLVTRNPSLVVGQQRIALLAIALAQALRQTMQPQHRTPAMVVVLARIAHDLCLEIQRRGECAHWRGIVRKLMQPMPGRFLTEAEGDDIGSVAKVVAAVTIMLRDVVREGIATPTDTAAKSTRVDDAALAVLAESVSRGVRIFVKQKAFQEKRKMAYEDLQHRLLQHTLNIDPDDHVHARLDDEPEPHGVQHDASFDMEKAKLRSGKFFRQRWTNCPPQAVVAAFGFVNVLLRTLHKHSRGVTVGDDHNSRPAGSGGDGGGGGQSMPLAAELAAFAWLANESDASAAAARSEIAQAMATVTMASFAHKYTHDECDHWDLQVALFVQALQRHSSKTRRNGLPSLRDSRAIIQRAAASVRQYNYKREVAAKIQRLRIAFLQGNAAAKFQLKLQEQDEFLQTHDGVARMFTPTEVAEFNATRAADDQIELTSSGLPRHHCAFPKWFIKIQSSSIHECPGACSPLALQCPQYLVNLSTDRDRALGLRQGVCIVCDIGHR
ncbi:hypothetical protein PTSG_03571 [Salpingoeca rosetta]|uniref:Uncharacterized protein n=1 Tax=Salpingoeca rosetta (strain ATCC 50818 / BSB-021) TaxID=946362 RepID=F2U5Z7_SALR5|nr:uncharacterized protein PTSG_03571 [Salpingoeca rosetta]EGD82938.1 hypothetical protein PTSG_03571 [Salpingoeca rosetta]|eukprot:XP_004995302.1 hypothetical protein PTSG_03571 [Salpingoeca rosetta]